MCHMHVMSNPRKVFGAAVLCYGDPVREFAKQVESDLYIIPSSTHEILILPKEPGSGTEVLKDLIWEINRQEVEADEYLSDSLYVYDRQKDTIEIAE